MVDIAIGHQNRAQRRVTQPGRVQRRTVLHLRTDIGRGVEDGPVVTIDRNGERRLRRRGDVAAAGGMQFAQPQFHCGRPPPAAAPST